MDNKKLVETVAANLGRSDEDVSKLLEALAGVLRTRCGEMDCVYVPGFGTFEPRLRKGRAKARNPKTGEQLSVAPHYVAAFRSGQELKKALWELPVKSK